MADADDLPLSAMTIVVTRPQQQGEATAHALRAWGAAVMEMPLLEITALQAEIPPGNLAHAYAVIFVSANAVEQGVPALARLGGVRAGTLVAAIGHATTHALHAAGFADVVSPQQSIDSEGLLAMPQLQAARVKGQHIILVRGKSAAGGRKLLEETLSERGAIVSALECYERREIPPAPGQVQSLVNDRNPEIAMMALSVETLESLMKCFAAHASWLRSLPLLVPHARVAAAAADQGFHRVHTIPMAIDALLPALLALKPALKAPPKT